MTQKVFDGFAHDAKLYTFLLEVMMRGNVPRELDFDLTDYEREAWQKGLVDALRNGWSLTERGKIICINALDVMTK